jgi:type III secretory pathway component EscR
MEDLNKAMYEDEKKSKVALGSLKYLKFALRAFNEHLLKTHGFEIADIDNYFHKVYHTFLIGNKDESKKNLEHLRDAFNSLGVKEEKDDLRSFLLALYKIQKGSKKTTVSTNELLKMVKPVSNIDRIKSKFKIASQYFLPAIATPISIVLMILNVVKIIMEFLHV